MAPRVKKTYAKKQKGTSSNSLNKKNETGCEKENKNLEEKCLVGSESEKANDFDKLFKSPLKENLNVKPLGFWSQKLKNLEPENSFTKLKKHGLYEFSGTETDESSSPYKRKKKVKQKRGPRKKKQPVITNPVQKPKGTRLLKKIKQIHSQSLFKEQFILKKEREKLADNGKKFTFSTGGMPSLGITSTPAVNKVNLVGASNFLFLSPIVNEESNKDNPPLCTTPKPKTPNTPVEFETPKLPEKRLSCRRVLRNGKIL